MAPVTYEVIRLRGAWRIVCGGHQGAPYMSRQAAVADAEAVARMLRAAGQPAVVVKSGAENSRLESSAENSPATAPN